MKTQYRLSQWFVKAAFLLLGGCSIGNIDAQTLTTVVNNGAPSNRADIVFIGDGYQSHELGTTYRSHIESTLDHMFVNSLSSPFNRYRNFFNVHAVNIASNQSGADDPINNIYVNTALDASYRWDGVTDRLLYFSTSKANSAVNAALSGSGIDVDMRVGLVNHAKYGGGGGQWAVYSGGNATAREIALHEIGHSFSGLADEYFYDPDATYTGGELSQWNVTNNPNSGKWDRWVGYNDPTTNIGPIGYYEGGRYYAKGIWRPSDNSKMRALDRPFDAISREKIIYDIYSHVRPLDSWLDNSSLLLDPEYLWVSSVDSDVIKVKWYLNGEFLNRFGEDLSLASLGLTTGTYEISALAYDEILDYSFSGGSMDWWRLDSSRLQQSVSWNVSWTAIPEPGSAFTIVLLAGMMFYRVRPKMKSNFAPGE